MSKNMTRKGLALGAAASLVATGFAALPAQATGIANDYVVLADTEEYGNYNMLSTGYIEISGSFAFAAESGGELKFYVSDPDEISVFDVVPESSSDTMGSVEEYGDAGSGAEIDSATAATISGAGTAEATITFPIDGSSGIEDGDVITIADLAGTSNGTTALTAAQKAVINGTHKAIVTGTGASQTIAIKVDDSDNVLSALTAETITEITITETTDSSAMDTVAELRVAGFGAAGVVGVATARSTAAATDGNYVVDTNEENTSAGDQVVRFATASDADYGSIVVTGWIDNDNDGVIDGTEYVSDPLTITFVVPSAATYTIAQEGVYIGSDSVTAVVTADLNLIEISQQSLLEVSIDHIDNGSTVAETDATLSYDTTDENLQGSDTDLNNNLASGDSIRFAVESANTEVGAPATFGVGSLTVAGSALSVPATANNTRVLTLDADGTGMTSATSTVRKGTATVSGVYTAYDGDPTNTTADKVVPNVPYTISVTSSGVTAADGVKFNGKTVDGGTETIVGYTNASGQIALTLTQTAADASDTVTVSIVVQGLATSGLVVFSYEAADYNAYDAASELTSSTEYNASMLIGGTYSRTFIVADQFGTAPANGAVVLSATRSGSRSVLAADWSYDVPVVDGKATLTIKDNGSGTGSDTVSINVYPLLVGGGKDATDDTNTFTLTYLASLTDSTPTAVTAVANYDGIDDSTTDDKAVALEPDALVNYDARATKGANSPSYETYNVDHDGDGSFSDAGSAQLTLSGTVTNATGGVVPGALVTIAAQGASFKYTTGGSNAVYAVDTITVRASAAGTYTVDVFGGTGGKKTFTVTAGAATATTAVTFVAGGAVASFTLTAPGASEPGKTVDVAIKLVDKYGNPVQGSTVTLSSTGPGYLLNTTGTTLANGTYNTKLLVGSNDSGTAVISATVTIDGVETTKTARINIGVGAVAGDGVVNVGSFSGKLVVYAKNLVGKKISWKVAGKWGTGTATKALSTFVRPTGGAGKTVVVELYVDGVKQLTKSVVTK